MTAVVQSIDNKTEEIAKSTGESTPLVKGDLLNQKIHENLKGSTAFEKVTHDVLVQIIEDNETLTDSEQQVLTTYLKEGTLLFSLLVQDMSLEEALFAALSQQGYDVDGVITLVSTFFPNDKEMLLRTAYGLGVISQEDALQIALENGFNIDDIFTESTAANGSSVSAFQPLGVGEGAGGTGGGGNTASSN